MYLLKITFLLLLIIKSESARILAIFAIPSISHQAVFRPLTNELAARGHEVVVITTDPAFPMGNGPKNLYEIDVHDLSYYTFKNIKTGATGKKWGIIEQMRKLLYLTTDVVEKQLLTEEIQKMINDKNITFDLIIVEALSRPAMGYSHIYNAPVIQFSSFGGMSGTFEMIGAPSHHNLYPVASRQKSYNLTLWQSIYDLFMYNLINNVHEDAENYENEMLRKTIDPKIPAQTELKKNVQMVFLNVHPLWDSNRPVPKNVIYLNGIHTRTKPKKDLPQDLKSYLDKSENGVVYVSFGTNSKPSSLPLEKIQIFTDVFSQLHYDVLLKWDKEELQGCPENVKIAKWLPQSDLLKHPNIKAFVTQGGLQSTDEAIDAGVPLVGIPLLIDQWFNSEKYNFYKIGINLDMETLTADILKHAISTVINDTSYRKNILKLRSIMRDEAQTALQRAVWWTEYVLRHGGAALRASAANMHWTQYYEIELVVIVLAATFGSLIVICLAISIILNMLSKFTKRKSE